MLPGYTYTRWFHDFVSKADCVLFPLYNLQFINPALPPKRGNCTPSNVLGAMGETGRAALRNAAASGCGIRDDVAHHSDLISLGVPR